MDIFNENPVRSRYVLSFDINLVGSYHFSDVHLQGEFRPLRELESRRERGGTPNSSLLIDQEVGEKGSYGERENPEEEPVVQLSLLEDEGG